MPAPEGFQIPTLGHSTGSQGTLKGVVGNIGHQSVRFEVHKVFNEALSAKTGLEVRDEIPLALFKNDAFNEVPVRVKDLSKKQIEDTQDLYNRFMLQKDSTDTVILEWDAIDERDRRRLDGQDIRSVEQLANWPEAQIFQLGPGGRDLVAKAKRHVLSKNGGKSEDREDFEKLMEENKRLREQNEKRDADYFAMQARLAELENATKKRGPRKQVLPEAVDNA